MRIFKRAAAFLLACLTVTGCLHFLLRDPSELRVRYREFLRGDCHQVILGHSLSRDGLDPRWLSQEPVYNLGSPITLPLITGLLEDLDSRKGLDKVYLELCHPYFLDHVYNRSGNMLYDETMSLLLARHRPVKWLERMSREDAFSALFNFTFSPKKLRGIPERVAIKTSEAYRTGDTALLPRMLPREKIQDISRGYAARTRILPGESRRHPFSREAVASGAVADFRYMADYCRAHDIELVVFASALPRDWLAGENYPEIYEFYQQLCRDSQVPFYDLNYVKWEYFPREAALYRDDSGHGLPEFARMQAQVLQMIEASDCPEQYFETSLEAVMAGFPEEPAP